MVKKNHKKSKLPKKLLARYGELWLLRDALEQKFVLGQGTVSDRISYCHILDEIADIRKMFRS